MSEDETVRYPHQLNEGEFEQLRETVEDRVVWHDAVRGVTQSRTRLSN